MTAAPLPSARVLQAGMSVAGKLELIRPVGEGGMGLVWIARNVMTGAKVAIKVLHPSRDRTGEAAERFRYEAKLGAKLAHRNITRVFDLLEDVDGSLVLVMELLQGENLSTYYSARGGIPCREAVAIMIAVLAGLKHAHDQGVIHRDLKPTNIFLHVDPDGQVTPKLLDFGIAKSSESTVETKTGEALGTPSYMSPEQVRAAPLDARSDIFSAGIVLYEVIAGASPYTGKTSSAVLAQVLELEIDPDPRIDPRLWIEVNRAISKQPYARHASVEELSRALAATMGETESALVSSLRRDAGFIVESAPDLGGPALPPVRPTPPEKSGRQPTGSASASATPAPPLQPIVSVRWPVLAGLGGLGVLAVMLFVVLGKREPTSPSPATSSVTTTTQTTAPATATTAASPSPEPSPVAPSASGATEEPRPAVSVGARHPPPSSRPTAPRGSAPAKPLARTPGF